MKKVTVKVDEATYHDARLWAALQDTSVSALVRGFLISLAQCGSEFERLHREEIRLREQVVHFEAGNQLTRDALHQRGVWWSPISIDASVFSGLSAAILPKSTDDDGLTNCLTSGIFRFGFRSYGRSKSGPPTFSNPFR